MKLEQYNQKRDFSKTPEPKGTKSEIVAKNTKRFVVQKHNATRLHFDFRLEHKGVLVSFAVPKNLSKTKGQKRLAIKTEDHPLSYIDFEGTIPKGQYGAGSVKIWDKGYYHCQNLSKGLKEGKFKIALAGKVLCGVWAFVKMQDNNWLVICEQNKQK